MTPDNKFNALQKSAYLLIMMGLMPLIIITGLMLMNIVPWWNVFVMVGGLKVVTTVHYLLAAFFFSFLFIHFYLASLGHTFWAHFITMFTGWEEGE